MKKSIGEIKRIAGGIAVLTIFQIPVEDGREVRISEESMGEGIQQRCEVTDPRAPEHPSRSQHAVSLSQASDAVLPFD
jgi:hypothetical protein